MSPTLQMRKQPRRSSPLPKVTQPIRGSPSVSESTAVGPVRLTLAQSGEPRRAFEIVVEEQPERASACRSSDSASL